MANKYSDHHATITKAEVETLSLSEILSKIDRQVEDLIDLARGDRYNSYADQIIGLKDLEIMVAAAKVAYANEEDEEGSSSAASKELAKSSTELGLVVKALTLPQFTVYAAGAIEKWTGEGTPLAKAKLFKLREDAGRFSALSKDTTTTNAPLPGIEDTSRMTVPVYVDPAQLIPTMAELTTPNPGQATPSGSNFSPNPGDIANTAPTSGISPAAANAVATAAEATTPSNSNFTTNIGDVMKRAEAAVAKFKAGGTAPATTTEAAAPAAPAAPAEPAAPAVGEVVPTTKGMHPKTDPWPTDLNDPDFVKRLESGATDPVTKPGDWI